MSEHRAAPQVFTRDCPNCGGGAMVWGDGDRVFLCRKCGSTFAAPQEGETPGARGKCPTCGSAVTITHAKIGEPVYEPADSAARPQGWQPISTAPKDGTAILVFQRSSMRVCSWSPGGWAFYQRREGAPIVVMTQATHWMPLPAPPEAREDEKP